ncbi:MAG: septum site-determining protein MinC [Pseudomonadota bacterium]
MQQTTPPSQSIRFSGRSFMAFVLLPTPPIADWLEEFDTFARRSPGFFAGRPVVVDISAMPPTRPDLVHMVTELKRRHITIMGLDGRTPGELGADARGLPPILTGGREIASIAQASAEMLEAAAAPKPEPQPEEAPAEAAETAASTDTDEASAKGEDKAADAPAKDAVAEAALAAVEKAVDEPSPASQALLIDQPVRSGQSIVHLTGDVTVIGSVASGSEIVASGSIHVYGALRGRAIAGSNGNRSARIFCSALHAELVAIDGLYKTAEDLDRKCIGKAVQAWLDGDALKMAAFNGKG